VLLCACLCSLLLVLRPVILLQQQHQQCLWQRVQKEVCVTVCVSVFAAASSAACYFSATATPAVPMAEGVERVLCDCVRVCDRCC